MKKIVGLLMLTVAISSFSFTLKNVDESRHDFRLTSYKNRESYTKDYILSHKDLVVMYIGNDPQFDGDEYQVNSYQLLIIPKVGEAMALTIIGNKLPYNMDLQPGTKLVFENISFTRNDQSNEVIKQLFFTVK
jgi:hypothetical protein